MEIIKSGNLERLKKIIYFNCYYCGCEFKASKDEYIYSGNQIDGDYWSCKCPTCGNKVDSTKKCGW